MWHWWNDDRLIWLLWPGLCALAVAIIAWLGDRRRRDRADLDAVGFVPWTPLFVLSTLVALVLLGLAGRVWLTG